MSGSRIEVRGLVVASNVWRQGEVVVALGKAALRMSGTYCIFLCIVDSWIVNVE